jgi:threonine synthase
MASYTLLCTSCGHEQPEDEYVVDCPRCGGLVDVRLTNAPEARAFDDRYPSIFRYHAFMPYEPTEANLAAEDLAPTPERLDSALSEFADVAIVVKDETGMPTGTWKDREGFVSLHRLAKHGIQDMVLFSSGNTGTSLARSAGRVRGPRLHIIVPKASEARVRSVMGRFCDPDFVELVFFDGSNDECTAEAARYGAERGFAVEGGFSNYARREGLKLLALEHLDRGEGPVDWYAQSVASGIGIYSFEKACREAGVTSPRLLGVQATICAPMVRAWEAGAQTLEDRFVPDEVVPSDFVRVLRTRKPASSYPAIKGVLDRTDGAMTAVDDAAIHRALRAFYRSEYFRGLYHERDITVGLEAATALAGVQDAVKRGIIARGSRVLLNVSGAAKKGDVKREWLDDVL